MKVKIMLAGIYALYSLSAQAVVTQPAVTWRGTFGGQGKTADEALSIVHAALAKNLADYNYCISVASDSTRSPMGGTCTVMYENGVIPDPGNTSTLNGSPLKMINLVTYHTENISPQSGNSSSDENVAFGEATLGLQCNSNQTTKIVAPNNGKNLKVYCEDIIPPPENNCTSSGNPVNYLSGDKVQHETDFIGAAGLSVTRQYINQRQGWTIESLPRIFDFTNRYMVDPNSVGATGCMGRTLVIDLYQPNLASPDLYDLIKVPTSFCLAYTNLIDTTPKITLRTSEAFEWDLTNKGGYYGDNLLPAKLYSIVPETNNGAAWMLHYDNNKKEFFDKNGLLIKTLDTKGNYINYAYNNGKLISKTNRLNETVSYMYDVNGNVQTVQLPSGKTLTYSYKYVSAFSLVTVLDSVTYTDGNKVTYEYKDSRFPLALTGVMDTNNKQYATWAYDSAGRAISSQHAGGADLFSFDYSSVSRTVVTNSLGKKTSYNFAIINGRKLLTSVTGEPSANCGGSNKNYTYTSEGWVASKTDWNGNKTTYTYNPKGQEISRTEGFGSAVAKTIITEWHATLNLRTKITEAGKETIYTYDANGLLLNQNARSLP